MTFPLPPNATIGIVGGGQLGRMSAMAAARLGYRCHIFTPEPDAPASQVASLTTLADYDDHAALIRFAESVDVITFEFENVSAEGLDLLAERRPVRPGPDILRISQDRIAEKTFLNAAGVRTAPWAPVESIAQLQAAIATIGLPAVLKTTRLGYDGKGQALIRTAGEAEMAFALLNPKPLILEGFVDFACECSVIVARGADGADTAFDTVENRHRDHILDLTLAPAPFDPDLRQEAQAMALRVADHLALVGLMAVEFFIDRDGRILANEIAPRPHNSGHWTIDACPASQFELHIRAVAGLALPQAVRHSDAVMKNLVGPADIALWPQIVATQGLIPHHYGKTAAREGRKLGHVNTLFPHGALPGAFGIAAALGILAPDEP
ncbi:5-(carboxyamino)imidazole ribonucleotide synthase [Acidiphilium sp. PA]|uniref:5-(carboxyamino)imidazole ribonucleotide synthase n=1 Tax=Acidiphilium sp. PA TaxID=2871705 RepID=UPI002244E00A|nr:5-(carboxyamino)imidazole ribonucleotide synthase [Acidiphilium sp. PA]MCW8306412.1 5-(carboxyamino)imidazole ribonucleotide synthase [Acidiphilium sp. PA]